MRVWKKIKSLIYVGMTIFAMILMNIGAGCAGVLASDGAEGAVDSQTGWLIVGIIAVAVIVAVIIAAVTSVISGVVGAQEDGEE